MTGIGANSKWVSVLFIVLFIFGDRLAEASKIIDYNLKVNGITIDVLGREPPVPEVLKSRTEKGLRKWIVQFVGPIRNEDKARVTGLGCQLLDYLPEFAFTASMDDGIKKKVKNLPFIRGVTRFKPAYKLSEKLREMAVTAGANERVKLNVIIDDSVNLSRVLPAVHRLKGTVLDVGPTTMRVEVETSAIASLAAEEEVMWIEEHFAMQIFNDIACWTIQTFIPNELKIWNHGLHGEGQIVGIADTGVDYDMPWFRDPLIMTPGLGHRKMVGYDTTYGDMIDCDNPGHGTHVAGTVAGDRTPIDGRSEANGMAPKARIFFQDITPGSSTNVYPPNDLGLLFATAFNTGSRLHTNSWGNVSNAYGSLSASADRFVWDNQEFLALFANGNSGPATLTVGNPAVAKNVISVGASNNGSAGESVAWFSSNGPTADGRIKPTVTAPGYAIVSADSDGLQESHNSGTVAMSGTSMATPAVAGAAALVRQYFMEGFQQTGAASPAVAFTPSGALVKAALINSAQNMTGADTDGAIPSTGQGWGRINLANVLSFTGDARKMDIVDERNGLSTGELWSRVILVDGAQPFKVTVVWADYPGTIGASKALVNDLDLAVTCPDGATLTGNAFANGESIAGGLPDRLNVEEQVMIKHPLSGYYTISVHGYNVPNGPQPFAYVASAAFNATSRGTIRLDRRTYNSRGTLELSVADRDLNLDPGIAEQISILVSSTSEPAGERVILTESRADSAVFTGILALNGGLVMPADGLLQVAQGDSISATYLDANDGSGQSASVTAHAGVDNTAPVISGFAASDITETTARLSWTTDEPTSATIDYGETTDTRETVVKQTLAVDHQVRLSGLREATTYYAHLHGRDEANNETTSVELTITTLSMPPSLTITSSDGESTIRDSVIVSGQSIDPSGVAAVTVNGVPVSYRPSDGYYEIRMTLQYGANNLTALAIDSLGNAATRTISVTRIKVPDLEVTAVSGPALAKSGQTLMVADSVTARSEGTNAPSFFLEVYLSADSSCGVGDISIGGRYVEPLSAGESRVGSTQVTVPANVASGNYYYCAIADPLGNVAEVNTTNNALAGNQVTVVGADLEVTAVSGPAVGRSGQALTIVDTVRARPEAGAAPSSYLQVFLSTDSQCSVFDISLGGHAVADLAAGESRTGSTQVTVPADLPTGSYYYCAIADPVDVVPEENEANNTLAGNRLTVVGADLEVTAVSGPATAKSGQVLTIADTVRNRPEAGAGPSSYLQLFLSIDSQCSVFDISLGGHAVAALAAGESRTGSTQVTVPASLPSGSYYYCAIADPAGVVPEGNEANNALAGNRVTVVGADLEVTAVSGPATAKSGQPITIADTVRNRLEAGAAPSSYLQVFLSTDSQCSLFDTSLGGHAIAALAAGESRTGSTQVTMPVNLPPGSYYYCAIADPAGVVPEGNESNNTLVGNLVTVVGADLEVTAVSGPATAKSGQPITIADTVWTRPEAGAAPASYLQVFLSTDSQCNVFDTSLGGHAVAVLAAGESRTGSTQVTVPVSPGSYYYCALVDPAGAVPEENETNNTLVGNQVTVVPREAVGTDLLFAGNFYQSITSVYAGVGNGATATIKARAVVLAEDLQFGKNAIINLIGGYDPVFASVVGVTTLRGTVTIIDGTLIVENVAIE